MSEQKKKKKKIKFNQQNSRISFGSIIFEAAKQGEWENLELILHQDEGKPSP